MKEKNKEPLFGIAMGTITGYPINLIVFNGNLISAFFLGMGFTLFWLIIYKKCIKNPGVIV